jgi:hypothetical protein
MSSEEKARLVIDRMLDDAGRLAERDYIVANGAYSNKELREENITLFAQMVRNYGSAEVVDEALESLSGFMLRAG